MRKCIVAVSFVVFCSTIVAQAASAGSGAVAPNVVQAQVSNGPGAAFQFTKVDDALLADANAIDADYEKKGLVLHDPGLQAYIDAVGKRVLGDRPVPEKVTYRFLVLRDPMVNAFALWNGSVYIPTGLLALLENEAQLAGVLGHETAHVYERHPYLENRSLRKKVVASKIIEAAASSVPGGHVLAAASAVAASDVSTLLLQESVYGYRREKESQADGDGLAAMTVPATILMPGPQHSNCTISTALSSTNRPSLFLTTIPRWQKDGSKPLRSPMRTPPGTHERALRRTILLRFSSP